MTAAKAVKNRPLTGVTRAEAENDYVPDASAFCEGWHDLLIKRNNGPAIRARRCRLVGFDQTAGNNAGTRAGVDTALFKTEAGTLIAYRYHLGVEALVCPTREDVYNFLGHGPDAREVYRQADITPVEEVR